MIQEMVKVDRHGNKYKIFEDGRILLKLAKNPKAVRRVGQLFRGALVVEKNDRHLLRVNTSWGFNEQIVTDLDPREIWVLYKGKKFRRGYYHIDRDLFDQVKEYLHFKTKGFERQVFVPVSFFKMKAAGYIGREDGMKKKKARVIKIGDPITFITGATGNVVAMLGNYVRVKFHNPDLRKLGFNEEFRRKRIVRTDDGVVWESTLDDLRAVLQDRTENVVFK